MSEVRVRVVEIEGKQVAFVDFIDREHEKYRVLNNRGEWQDAGLYQRAAQETMLEVTMGRPPA